TISVIFTQTFSLYAQTPVYLNANAPVDERADDLLGRMTLDEKIGQMTQVDHTNFYTNREEVTNCFIGSILSGGSSESGDNTTESWANLYDSLQQYALNTRLKIPMIYGIDAVHGNNNIYGATIFPHNIGLGCTRNPDLVAKTAEITAVEIAATGIDWNFAPCIAVPRDENWGRFYEGFGETPELAEEMGVAYTRGLQGDNLSGKTSILASIKHYVGDGGTYGGDDQGNVIADEKTIREIHLPGYIAAIKAGALNVMASYSSINGAKMHGSKYWLTDVLKDELEFKGFTVSDWGGVDQLGPDYKENVMKAINAGIDMVMLPRNYKEFQADLKSLINEGKVSISRIDDAVRRILKVKFELGLFERPFADRSLISKVGSQEHREVARQAVRESLVLLKNTNNALPFSKINTRILVAGSHADNIGYQCGGWTIAWQGDSGDVTIGTTILEGIKKTAPSAQIDYSIDANFTNTKADYSIVVIGEKPYAEGVGDSLDITISKNDIDLIKKMKSYGAPVVVVLVSGRPMIIQSILDDSDAIIAAWLPGTEGDGISDVLFGDYQPKGLLSHSWPRSMDQIPINIGDDNYDPLYEYGFGITSFEKGSTD
ncbi:MAG: glycoside hydrolase family 3 N-terminal domain-containing protein, partial [Ignavibacteriaceae bacterium]